MIPGLCPDPLKDLFAEKVLEHLPKTPDLFRGLCFSTQKENNAGDFPPQNEIRNRVYFLWFFLLFYYAVLFGITEKAQPRELSAVLRNETLQRFLGNGLCRSGIRLVFRRVFRLPCCFF